MSRFVVAEPSPWRRTGEPSPEPTRFADIPVPPRPKTLDDGRPADPDERRRVLLHTLRQHAVESQEQWVATATIERELGWPGGTAAPVLHLLRREGLVEVRPDPHYHTNLWRVRSLLPRQ